MTSVFLARARASVMGAVCSLIGAATMLCACGGTAASSDIGQGDTLRLKYSQLLTIVEHEGYTTVDIANPWKNDSRLHRYVLVDEDVVSQPVDFPEATVVRVPLSKSIVFSEVHAALVDEMGRKQALVGLADVMYYTDSVMLADVKTGAIADVGLSANPALELIIDLSPDAILLSPFENSGGYGKLEQLGIPLIECADYMEPTPLGRAEWVKFYGLLYGAEARADSLFAATDSAYNALKNLAATAEKRPTVMMDKLTGSTWYVPGGRSTIGTLLADAGMRYLFGFSASENKREHSAEDAYSQSAGSLPLSFETVLDCCAEADLWLFRHNFAEQPTYNHLLTEHSGYARFSPFQRKKCFGCNTNTSRFFIETPFHPDRLLANLIAIAHPQLVGETKYAYFFAVE